MTNGNNNQIKGKNIVINQVIIGEGSFKQGPTKEITSLEIDKIENKIKAIIEKGTQKE